MDKKENGGTRENYRGAAEKLKDFMRRYVTLPGNTDDEKRRELKIRLKKAAVGAGYALTGFMFARATLPFAVAPFGAALLCAGDVYTPFIYVGLCVSSLFSPAPLAYFLMYTLGLLVRIGGCLFFAKDGERAGFNESLGLRILAAVTMAFMIGVYRTAAGGFLFYDLFGCMLGLVAVPAAVPVFRVALERKATATGLRDACIAAMTAVGVWSLSGLTVAGFSLSTVAALVVALYVSRECGALRAGVVGLLCGLTVGLQWAPLFALAGLIAGLFWRVSALAATAAALGIGVFYSVWVGGSASILSMAPDLLCACVIFAPLAHFGLLPSLPLYGGGVRAASAAGAAELHRRGREGVNSRFEAMQQAFSSLSDVFRRMSEKTGKPTCADISAGCEKIFTRYCENCARHSLCWEQNREESSDAVGIAARKIKENGRVLLGDMPDGFLRRCLRGESIINDVNADYSMQIERLIRENKTEIFAQEFGKCLRDINPLFIDLPVHGHPDFFRSHRTHTSFRHFGMSASTSPRALLSAV